MDLIFSGRTKEIICLEVEKIIYFKWDQNGSFDNLIIYWLAEKEKRMNDHLTPPPTPPGYFFFFSGWRGGGSVIFVCIFISSIIGTACRGLCLGVTAPVTEDFLLPSLWWSPLWSDLFRAEHNLAQFTDFGDLVRSLCSVGSIFKQITLKLNLKLSCKWWAIIQIKYELTRPVT